MERISRTTHAESYWRTFAERDKARASAALAAALSRGLLVFLRVFFFAARSIIIIESKGTTKPHASDESPPRRSILLCSCVHRPSLSLSLSVSRGRIEGPSGTETFSHGFKHRNTKERCKRYAAHPPPTHPWK